MILSLTVLTVMSGIPASAEFADATQVSWVATGGFAFWSASVEDVATRIAPVLDVP